jgi:two-component system, sensor histidine kinase and response regulator
LLVDDNDLNQQVGADLLTDAGLVVDVADNGQMALDMLARTPYDAVLMDMQMPVMDGLTATRRLRENPAWAQLPVLAMTANAMAADRDRCLQAGMNGHIAKPIDPDELFATLLRWIAPRTPAPTPPGHPGLGAEQDLATGSAQPSASLASSISSASSATAAASVPTAPSADLPSEPRAPQPIALPASSNPAAVQPAPQADPLAGIDGLDTAAGLRRVLNKRATYEGLLRKFVAGQADAAAAVRAQLSAGQRDDAQRAMHTLKGTAGTIGAAHLAELAQAAEQALAQGQPAAAIETLLQPIEAASEGLIAALRSALPPEEADEPVTAADTEPTAATQQLISKLDALLADDDSDAIELFHESAPALRAALGPAYADMQRALDNYQFVEALAALRSVRTAHA